MPFFSKYKSLYNGYKVHLFNKVIIRKNVDVACRLAAVSPRLNDVPKHRVQIQYVLFAFYLKATVKIGDKAQQNRLIKKRRPE